MFASYSPRNSMQTILLIGSLLCLAVCVCSHAHGQDLSAFESGAPAENAQVDLSCFDVAHAATARVDLSAFEVDPPVPAVKVSRAATTKPSEAKAQIQTAAGPQYGGYTHFLWFDGKMRDVPEPGAYYPTAGGVLVQVSSHAVTKPQLVAERKTQAQSTPLAKSGHWENRQVCHGSYCTVQRVWVPDQR